MSTEVKPKVYLAGLTITTGLLSMKGNVYTPKKPGTATAGSPKMACPLHPDTPHGVKQRYVCINDTEGEAFEPGACLKALVDEDDHFVLVNKDDIKEAKKSEVPAKTLDLRSHPYDQARVFAAGHAYVFQPEGPQQFYATLLESLSEQGVLETDDGPKMLVGLVSFRSGTESFVRLERWGDQLVIRELIRPEDVQSFQKIDAGVDTRNLAMFKQLVAATSEDFDAETYRSQVRERIASLAVEAGSGKVKVASVVKPSMPDMATLLEQSLALAKAKK